MSSNKKTPAVVETMTPEDVKVLISIRDWFKEASTIAARLTAVLNNLGASAGQAKGGVMAATEKPAAKPPKLTPRKKAAEATKTREPGKAPVKPQTPAPKPAPEKPAATAAAPEKKATVIVRGASVRMTDHELTLNIGAQPVKALAEQDARELLNNPKVFWFRGIQFPDPKRYRVQPRIESARVVERSNPKFTRAPWTVSVTITAIGDDKRCSAWLTGVLNKNRSEQE